MTKLWITRTGNIVELWSRKPRKVGGFYNNDHYDYNSRIYGFSVDIFKKHFSFTPRKNSCVEYNLTRSWDFSRLGRVK